MTSWTARAVLPYRIRGTALVHLGAAAAMCVMWSTQLPSGVLVLLAALIGTAAGVLGGRAVHSWIRAGRVGADAAHAVDCTAMLYMPTAMASGSMAAMTSPSGTAIASADGLRLAAVAVGVVAVLWSGRQVARPPAAGRGSAACRLLMNAVSLAMTLALAV